MKCALCGVYVSAPKELAETPGAQAICENCRSLRGSESIFQNIDFSDKWANHTPMTREDFEDVVKEMKKMCSAPFQPERYLIHVTKQLVDDFEATGMLGTLKHCHLIGSPEAIAYAEERIQAIMRKQ